MVRDLDTYIIYWNGMRGSQIKQAPHMSVCRYFLDAYLYIDSFKDSRELEALDAMIISEEHALKI